jgi:beta-galactosidase
MQKQSFNKDWRFFLGAQDTHHGREPDDSEWRILDLPHDWSIELGRSPDNPSGVSNGWFGMGCASYRRAFTAPLEWREKHVLVEFEGVYMNAEIWLNEHLLTRHPYGYTSFTVDLTPYLKIDGKNVLRVQVDNACQTNSRWYSGSGIYRPVWLIVTGQVHVAQYGVYVTIPLVSTQEAHVLVRTSLQNGSQEAKKLTVRSTIFTPGGAKASEAACDQTVKAAGEAEPSQEFAVRSPMLWSVERPDLYRMETEILEDGQVVDTATTMFGIRSIEFSADNGFLLNGQPLKLKGGCVHHDNGILGSASYPRAEERKVELLKASGFNAIRCAHNPPAPAMLDACDRLGMLVIDEAFDCWRIGKNPYDYHVVFEDWWQRDLDSMLYRDRNHPSIILWSIGNEVAERDGRSSGVEIARKLAERVRQVDPTRPVTSAINGMWGEASSWQDTDPVFDQLDVGGYNYLLYEYTSDHQRHPDRIMVGTESFPRQAFENWQAVLENPYVIGDFVWTSLDYLGESGIGRVYYGEDGFLGKYPWHQANCGDLDLCGFKRPQSHYRDMLWQNGHPLYIVVHTPLPKGITPSISAWGWPDVWPNWNWTGREGEPMKVEVYSACEKVELFLNDRSLGVLPTTLIEQRIATFEVAYEPGELKAIGYTDEKQVAEYVVQTVDVPSAIHLTPDRTVITPDDLCYVTVEIVDSSGRLHPSAENTIYFVVQGAGSLLAVGSSNPVSTEPYRGHRRSAYRGRCLVVVKANDPGEICLQAQADGLDRAEVLIMVKSPL